MRLAYSFSAVPSLDCAAFYRRKIMKHEYDSPTFLSAAECRGAPYAETITAPSHVPVAVHRVMDGQGEIALPMGQDVQRQLAALLGMIDRIEMCEASSETKAIVAEAKVAGQRLRRRIGDMLDSAAMRAGVFAPVDDAFDLHALIDESRISTETRASENGRAVVCKIDKNVPQTLLGDAPRLAQILSDLLDAALDFSKEGPILLRANAVPDPKGVLLQIDVEGFGDGISEQDILNIFRCLPVGSPLSMDELAGGGASLAFCKQLVEWWGGDLGIDACNGGGTTFWFELPLGIATRAEAANLPDEPTDEAGPAAPASQGESSVLDMMSPAAAKELLEMFSLVDLKEFAKKYVVDTSYRLEKILSAVQAGDDKVVAQQAHSLKGSSLVFGFQEIPEWAHYIEKSDPRQDRQAILAKTQQIRERLNELDALL
jgi:HPt (histidine-containing phosphotransfer) domain-containing protein